MQKIIHAALFTPMHAGPKFTGRWGIPLMFVGGPGGGKSTVLTQVCDAASMQYEILSPGERGEGAFGAIPVPQDGVVTYPQPEWSLKFLKFNEDGSLDPDGEAGVVVVDEFSTAAPHIQPALLGLILDARIGGNVLPNRVRRIGAMNEVADAAGGWEIAPALCNRLGWIPWVAPTETEWSSYWLGGIANDVLSGIDAAMEEARVLAAWPEAWSDAVGRVTAFVQRNAGMLDSEPKPGERAFATRRSVAAAMHALASAKVHKLSHADTATLVKGFVGDAWWKAYCAFIATLDLPDAAAVLDGRETWQHDKNKLDVTFVFLATAAALVTGEKDKATRQRRGEMLWSILAVVMPQGKDLGFDAAWALSRSAVALTSKDAIKVCAKLEEFRKAIKSAV